MFGFQPITQTLVAASAVTKGQVVVRSGTTGREQYGGPAINGSSGTVLAGIAVNEPAAGEALSVVQLGRVRAIAGGAVSQGVRVTANSVGRVTAAASGDVYIGIANEAAAANGDTFEVLVNVSGDRVLL